jgi:hypothetical protein
MRRLCLERWHWRFLWAGFGICVYFVTNIVDMLHFVFSPIIALEDSLWEQIVNPWVVGTYLGFGLVIDILIGKCARI